MIVHRRVLHPSDNLQEDLTVRRPVMCRPRRLVRLRHLPQATGTIGIAAAAAAATAAATAAGPSREESATDGTVRRGPIDASSFSKALDCMAQYESKASQIATSPT